mmetsp:Transcript_33552/g.76628  ORF Transcript_33552/g.76628 Transcript_33552/m.76628 type:complete len:213 (+) Transcript_33552:434-1072(+)
MTARASSRSRDAASSDAARSPAAAASSWRLIDAAVTLGKTAGPSRQAPLPALDPDSTVQRLHMFLSSSSPSSVGPADVPPSAHGSASAAPSSVAVSPQLPDVITSSPLVVDALMSRATLLCPMILATSPMISEPSRPARSLSPSPPVTHELMSSTSSAMSSMSSPCDAAVPSSVRSLTSSSSVRGTVSAAPCPPPPPRIPSSLSLVSSATWS